MFINAYEESGRLRHEEEERHHKSDANTQVQPVQDPPILSILKEERSPEHCRGVYNGKDCSGDRAVLGRHHFEEVDIAKSSTERRFYSKQK